MEALVALGLAANVVQFVDFGCRLVSKSREIRRSGSLSQHVNLDLIANDLENLSGKLEASLNSASRVHTCLTKEDTVRAPVNLAEEVY